MDNARPNALPSLLKFNERPMNNPDPYLAQERQEIPSRSEAASAWSSQIQGTAAPFGRLGAVGMRATSSSVVSSTVRAGPE